MSASSMIDIDALQRASDMLKKSERITSLHVVPRARLRFAAFVYNHIQLGHVKEQADVDALLRKIHRGELS